MYYFFSDFVLGLLVAYLFYLSGLHCMSTPSLFDIPFTMIFFFILLYKDATVHPLSWLSDYPLVSFSSVMSFIGFCKSYLEF